MYYKGWYIYTESGTHNVWRAERYGVRMCNTTKQGLFKMIDLRED